MSRVGQLLEERFQSRMPRLGARVTQRPVDANGRGLGYVVCEVAGVTGVRVATGPDAVYYPGDTILVEQRGSAAAASYVVLGWESGPRPDAGALEFTATTTIGNDSYGPGDLLWGNPFQAHFHMDYDGGLINLKVGSALTGQIDAGRGVFVAGSPTGLHGEFGPTGIEFLSGQTVLSGWDAAGRTIYGIETLGRPHGPGIQQREFVDPGTGETRYAWQILGLNGVPGVSFVTGSDTAPDDYKFYVGPAGASERLIYEAGSLTLTGAIHANSGTIAGWTITDDQLRSKGSSTVIDDDGIIIVNNQAGLHGTNATWRIWAGATLANIATAPFRVDKDGEIYATGIKALAGTSSAADYLAEFVSTSGSTGFAALKGEASAAWGVEAVSSSNAALYADSASGPGVNANGGSYGIVAAASAGIGGGFTGTTAAVKLESGVLDANAQNITNVNRLYFDATRYLYLSGSDLYWFDGSTGTKLN